MTEKKWWIGNDDGDPFGDYGESPQCPHEAIRATCGIPCGCSCLACLALGKESGEEG